MESDDPVVGFLMLAPCKGGCGRMLGLKETTSPTIKVIDEQEIPGD